MDPVAARPGVVLTSRCDSQRSPAAPLVPATPRPPLISPSRIDSARAPSGGDRADCDPKRAASDSASAILWRKQPGRATTSLNTKDVQKQQYIRFKLLQGALGLGGFRVFRFAF